MPLLGKAVRAFRLSQHANFAVEGMKRIACPTATGTLHAFLTRQPAPEQICGIERMGFRTYPSCMGISGEGLAEHLRKITHYVI